MKKPKALLGKIKQVHEGQAFYHKLRKNGSAVLYTVCCDCKLVHLEEYRVVRGAIRIKVWRDEVKTKSLRKRKK